MIALVPVKTLARAKSRLAGTLDPPGRARLMHDTLRRTVQALKGVESISLIAVITRDAEVSQWAQEWGASVIHEREDGLNESLRDARARFGAVDAVLVVPADLGWLDSDDIRAMAALAGSGPAVIIAPDRHERGTNALIGMDAPLIGGTIFKRFDACVQSFQARFPVTTNRWELNALQVRAWLIRHDFRCGELVGDPEALIKAMLAGPGVSPAQKTEAVRLKRLLQAMRKSDASR